MRMPEVLSSLVDEGIIEEVLRPLMSGKEAQIYLVEAAGQQYVAKVYKEANSRTFKHRSEYTEGRKVRNSRDQRAIDKRTKHGRAQDEAAWRSTEVDMIHRLRGAGVRVPTPYQFIDGVLIMELVSDANGQPAPRLGDVSLTPERAHAVYEQLIRETVRMLCAGVVHGDLSDYNVLLAADGPVIIDFPQSVDPSKNPNARRLLLRDVDNLHRFLSRFVPGARRMPYAEEMWALYESSQLTPDTVLRGLYRPSEKKADTKAVLELIGDANREAQNRGRGDAGAPAVTTYRPRRIEVIVDRGMLPRSKTQAGRGRPGPGAGRGPAPDTRSAARHSGQFPTHGSANADRPPAQGSGRGSSSDFRGSGRSPSSHQPHRGGAAVQQRSGGSPPQHGARAPQQRPQASPPPREVRSDQRRPQDPRSAEHPRRPSDERRQRPNPNPSEHSGENRAPRSSHSVRRQPPAPSSSRSLERAAVAGSTNPSDLRRRKP